MEAEFIEPGAGRDFFTKLTIRLFRYRALMRRRWWILVLTIGAGLLYQGWVVYTRPVEYESTGSLNLRERLMSPDAAQYSEDAQTFAGTQIATLQSPEVYERARRRLSMEAPELSGNVRVEATMAPRTSIFLVSGVGSDPLYTQKFVDAVMQEYIRYKGEKRSESTGMTMVQIGEQLSILRKEVDEEQKKLQQFTEENNMPFWEQQAQTATQYLTELKNKQANLRTELRRLQNLTSEQLLQSSRLSPRMTAEGGSGDTSMLAQAENTVGSDLSAQYLQRTQELVQKQAELSERSKVWKPKHPRLQAMQSEIDALQRLIETIKSQTRESSNARIAAIQAELQSLDSSIETWTEKSLEASRKDAEYKRRREAVATKQNLVEKLLLSMQSIDVGKTVNQETLQIWQTASSSRRVPVNAVKHLVTGFLLGFVLGFVVLVILDRADDRFTSSTEVMDQFDEAILGQIPDVSDSRTDHGLPLLTAEDERYMYAESFRSLRSSLIFMPNDVQLKLLLVSSSTPGEGKSTCASNLAITMALAGARVLLVDADLRRGDLAHLFNRDVTVGLSNVLRGEAKWQDAVQPSGFEHLSLLSRGPVTNQSGELLMAPTMEPLLEEFRTNFDLTIFNTSPILATDDTPTLAPLFDGTLMVVRANYTSAKLVRRSLEALYQRQIKVLGLILNCINTEMPDYYYYRYPKYYTA